jgi:hypothetical protein
MAGIAQVNGQVAIGSFYGPEQLMIRVADSGNSFTANTGGGTAAIVEGGFSEAVRAIQTVASVLWVGTRTDAGSIAVIVDANTVNRGDGVAGSGVTTGFGALKAAIVAATGATLGNLTVTSGTTFANTGAFTLA